MYRMYFCAVALACSLPFACDSSTPAGGAATGMISCYDTSDGLVCVPTPDGPTTDPRDVNGDGVLDEFVCADNDAVGMARRASSGYADAAPHGCDAGVHKDASVPHHHPDASVSHVDASVPHADAAVPVVDASVPVVDASAPVVDASAPVVDAAVPAPDANDTEPPPEIDAGDTEPPPVADADGDGVPDDIDCDLGDTEPPPSS